MFAAASERAAGQWGVPVLLCLAVSLLGQRGWLGNYNSAARSRS